MMNSNEVFILEDDPAVRRALEAMLAKQNFLTLFFADGDSLLAVARQKSPACIILDLQLPGKSGLQVLAELHEAGNSAPVFMMSGHGSIEIAVKAAKLGALKFFEKPFKPRDLIASIEKVLASKVDHRPESDISAEAPVCDPTLFESFTPRERQIWDQIARGYSSKDIARALGLSPRTVEDHRSNLLRKANVSTTAELLRAALVGLHRPKV
ncbi:response regulator transcription factor [Bradyrhizobium betae]|uniref:response regulator transcription factor n=1 Tax=Bradyrhizobium betae TaxID=244734 RepID=UPI003D67A71B